MAHPRIRVGVALGTQPPLGRTMAFARAARLLRLDSLWAVDHFQGWFPRDLWTKELTWAAGGSPHAFYDYQVLLGHLARRAGSAQLAVGVTEPVRRHPLLIAQAFLTLSHLTRRPPILGIGSGEAENIVPYGLPFDRPVARLAEALQVIRAAFESDGPFAHHGDFYEFDGAVMDIGPGPAGTPEIWLAAHGPRMLDLTGRFADGWYPTIPMTPDEYAGRLDVVHRSASTAGRDPDAIVAGLSAFVVIGSTEAEARRHLHHPALRFLGLLIPDYVWKAHGARHPLSDGHGGLVEFVPQSLTRSEAMEAIDRVDVDALAGLVLWGGPDQVVARIRRLGEAGLRHVTIVPASGLVSRRAAAVTIRALPAIARRLQRGT